MQNFKKTFLAITLLFSLLTVKAQDSSAVVTRGIIINGDTLPMLILQEVKIYAPVIFINKLEALSFTRLVNNVKRAYPYAKVASLKVQEYNVLIANAKTKKEKKRLMKEAQDKLREQFEEDVKNMTEDQGEILIKLIDRETGSSSYEIIKEFRGGVVAVFWQSFGRLFGYNLKTKYEPEGKDKAIEQIVIMIENGEL